MRLEVRTDWGEHKGMQKIKILVAMHKAYSLPGENIYAPIQVGGVRIPGMENALRDDTGENISAKNKYYCEMTALYWAWKIWTRTASGWSTTGATLPESGSRSARKAGSRTVRRSKRHWKRRR